jgi:UDP-glucuronate 4-epimerase
VNETEKGPSKEIYNIGRGKQVNLMDFVYAIENQLGKEAIIDFKPMHPADTKETYSDTTKLRALGYEPKVSIETGVKNFIDWYKEYYK